MEKIKVAFLGEKLLGVKCLEFLYNQLDVEISAVLCEKEENHTWADRVRDFAKRNDLPIIEDINELTNMNLDIGFSVQYRYIIKSNIIEHFNKKRGLINLHLGELPRYRGCNCSAHALMNARKDNHWKAGASLHYIDVGIDSGKVIDTITVPIKDNTINKELYTDVCKAGFEMFKENWKKFSETNGKVESIHQKEMVNMYVPSYYYYRNSISNKEVNLNWNHDKLWDSIRTLEFPPFPPAFAIVDGEKFGLFTRKPEEFVKSIETKHGKVYMTKYNEEKDFYNIALDW